MNWTESVEWIDRRIQTTSVGDRATFTCGGRVPALKDLGSCGHGQSWRSVCHQGLVLEIGRLEAKNKTARYRFVFRMRWTNTAGPGCCHGIFINALFRAYPGIFAATSKRFHSGHGLQWETSAASYPAAPRHLSPTTLSDQGVRAQSPNSREKLGQTSPHAPAECARTCGSPCRTPPPHIPCAIARRKTSIV